LPAISQPSRPPSLGLRVVVIMHDRAVAPGQIALQLINVAERALPSRDYRFDFGLVLGEEIERGYRGVVADAPRRPQQLRKQPPAAEIVDDKLVFHQRAVFARRRRLRGAEPTVAEEA